MDSTLHLTKERYLIERDYESYITLYENEGYKVFINEDENETYANVVRKSFEFPEIHIGNSGGVSVPALGTLNVDKIGEYIDMLNFAKETYLEILKLIKEL